MLLLAIETSSARGSLALLEGETEVAAADFPEGLVHGREIAFQLDALMRRAGLEAARLEAIAVGLGPGSYTGIRVGVTAAKTLAFALRIPVVGESSLRAIAANPLLPPAAAGECRSSPGRGAVPPPEAPGRNGAEERCGGTARRSGAEARSGAVPPRWVVPAIDGKQRHVYLARFRLGAGARAVERETEDRVVELPVLSPEARGQLSTLHGPEATVVGDAAEAILGAASSPGLVRGPREWDWPSARVLGQLAARAMGQRPPRFDPEAAHRLVPIYLRPSEAERKLRAAR